jgi:hypothetical protein
MRAPRAVIVAAALAAGLLAAALAPPAGAQVKDYLTQTEADRIRDAEQPVNRIKLFISFAADRLKKFEYELARGTPDRRRGERLNSLLNAYAGCIDDAAELIDLGRERQWDIRAGIKEMLAKGKEYLELLQKLNESGADRKLYAATLEDAILATEDALKDAEKADKEYSPPPIRRRQ